MSQYYYLVAGLPDLAFDDSKLNFSIVDFKSELYPYLSTNDKRLVDLFYLQLDNKNLLLLLKGREEGLDPRGNYSADDLEEFIAQVKDGGKVPSMPSYMADFVLEYLLNKDDKQFNAEDALAAKYYAYAMQCKNRFVSSWFEFNLTVRNVLNVLTARKFKLEAASVVVGDTEVCQTLRTSTARDFGLNNEIEYLDALMRISETADLVEREKKLDQLRWDWLENAALFDYFTIERLYVFLLRLEMVERWTSLDKARGNALFRKIIASLKSEVRIPKI